MMPLNKKKRPHRQGLVTSRWGLTPELLLSWTALYYASAAACKHADSTIVVVLATRFRPQWAIRVVSFPGGNVEIDKVIELVSIMQPHDKIQYAGASRRVGDLVQLYRHRIPKSKGIDSLLKREIPRFDGWRVTLNDRAWVIDFERVERVGDGDAEDVSTLKTLLVMMCLPGPSGISPRPFSEIHLIGSGIGLSVCQSKLFEKPIDRSLLVAFLDRYRWGDEVTIIVTGEGIKVTHTRLLTGTQSEPV